MREMRLKTPDACGQTSTSSQINTAPVAFSQNHNSAVCLPLVSDSKRLIWVHSSQISLQVDGAAELEKAFDGSPYLTQKQTATLARRCSLHPDQVKVWFMVQRLRYGISWDNKDIHKVWEKCKSRQGKVEVKEARREKKQWKTEVKESSEKKAGEVREEQSANEGRMMGESVRANERWGGGVKQEQPIQKKRKMVTVTNKVGKKRIKQGDEGVVERAGAVRSDEAERGSAKSKCPQLETALFTRMEVKANKRSLSVPERPAHKSLVIPDASPLLIPPSQAQSFDRPRLADNQTPNIHMTPVKSGFEGQTDLDARQEAEPHAEAINHNGPAADFGKPKELTGVNNNPVVADGCTPTRCNAKTQTQLAMLKAAFSHCQYPDREEYNRLTRRTGVTHAVLVKWFCDMRYYIKKERPSWMNQEQRSQALANIKYRQSLNALAMAQPREGGRGATWKVKVDRSESNGEGERVQAPPE